MLKNIRFNLAFSSDLSRAKATCQSILDANESGPYIQETDLIREKHLGQAEDMHYVQFTSWTMVLRRLRNRNKTMPQKYIPDGQDKDDFDGETKQQIYQRARFFIQDVLCQKGNFIQGNITQVLMVSHGEFLTHFFYVLSHDFPCSFTMNEKQELSKRPRNTSWCQVEIICDLTTFEIQNVLCRKTWNHEHLNALKSHICHIV